MTLQEIYETWTFYDRDTSSAASGRTGNDLIRSI